MTGVNNHWSLILLNINKLNLPIKKAQVKRLDMKTGSNILLFTRNIPQPQRQTLPLSKGLGKGFPIKWT